jgi:hypothetical protein
MLQETHLTSRLTPEGESFIDRAKNDFKKFGYRSTFTPARVTSKGGTSGGAAIAWKADRRASVFENIVPGRACGALVPISEIGDIMFISIYGYDGNVAETKETLRTIAQLLATVGKPFVIGGDFNANPAVVFTLLHELNFPATVLAPMGTTCQSAHHVSCIDFFVVHPKIHALCKDLPVCKFTGVVSPHDPVALQLQLPGHEDQGLFLNRPRKPPTSTHVYGPKLCIEQRTQSILDRSISFASSAGALDTGAVTRPPSDQEKKVCLDLWTSWCGLAQVEISSATGHSAQIPVELKTQVQPLSSVFASKASQRPVPSYASRWLFERTCELIALLKMPRSRDTAPQRAHRLRILAGARGVFTPRKLATFYYNLANSVNDPDNAPRTIAVEILATVQAIFRRHTRRDTLPPVTSDLQQLVQCQCTLRGLTDKLASVEWGISQKDYASFRDQALIGGARIAHQMTKLSSIAPDLEIRPNFIEEVAIEETKWHGLWQTGNVPTDFSARSVGQAPPFTRQAIIRASSSFDFGTSCLDGIPIKCIALCSSNLIEALSHMFHVATFFAHYPPALGSMVVKLIDKKDNTFRPIVLFRSLYRLHGRLLATPFCRPHSVTTKVGKHWTRSSDAGSDKRSK